ncbi:MAG: ABC transporter ATP-binding protein [Kiritimatiellae bacterium]|nr:ABC transporter ATP-binding protein [Kiritimatiellia bacterium]
MTAPAPVLSARDLRIVYRAPGAAAPVPVVEDVSFDLHPGRMLALVGESGCGKSVTAAALGGLLPRGMELASGSIDAAPGVLRAGRGLAYVFQDPGECLDPVFRVGRQIVEAMPPADRRHSADRLRALLVQVGFHDPDRVARSYPHQLSGGMQQRAMLAMALAGRPRILVADEPTTALDVTVQARLLRLLADLQRSGNLAVLLITHNLGVVAEVADDLLVMYAGRAVESGPVSLLSSPRHPYVEGLLRALPRLAPDAPPLEGIPGQVPALGRRPAGCPFHPRCPLARPECATAVPHPTRGPAGHTVACHVRAFPSPSESTP